MEWGKMSHPTGFFLAQKGEGRREHLPAEESPLSLVRRSCRLPGQTRFCRGADHSKPLSRPALAGLHLAGSPPPLGLLPKPQSPALATTTSLWVIVIQRFQRAPRE